MTRLYSSGACGRRVLTSEPRGWWAPWVGRQARGCPPRYRQSYGRPGAVCQGACPLAALRLRRSGLDRLSACQTLPIRGAARPLSSHAVRVMWMMCWKATPHAAATTISPSSRSASRQLASSGRLSWMISSRERGSRMGMAGSVDGSPPERKRATPELEHPPQRSV